MARNETTFGPGQGRKPGSKNKRTSPKALLEMINKHRPGYDPIVELLKLEKASQDPDFKAGIHKEVAKYVRPQLKAITQPITEPIDLGTASNPAEVGQRLMQLMAHGELSLDQGALLLGALANAGKIESFEERDLLLEVLSELKPSDSLLTKVQAIKGRPGLQAPEPVIENPLNFL